MRTPPRIPALLAKQERNAGHRWLGGLADEDGIHTAGAASGFLRRWPVLHALRACVTSAELAEPLRLAARRLLALQHTDGTIDLHTTNFASPPDTAFVLGNVCPALALLRASPEPRLAAAAEDLGAFIRRTGLPHGASRLLKST